MPDRDSDHLALFDLWAASKALGDLLDVPLEDAGFSGRELAAATFLAAAGSATPGELASWTGMAPSSVTTFLARLGRRGFVEKRPNPADRRSYHVRLTPRGRHAQADAFAVYATAYERVRRNLDVPAADLRRVLRALDDAIRDTAGLPRRPRAPRGASGGTVPYAGEPLTPDDEDLVRRHIARLQAKRRVRGRPSRRARTSSIEGPP